jgi:hypothetical protein
LHNEQRVDLRRLSFTAMGEASYASLIGYSAGGAAGLSLVLKLAGGCTIGGEEASRR